MIGAVQPFLLKTGGHLLRYFTKISPRRAKSTPAGNFCSCLVSASPIFKTLTQKGFSEATRMSVVPCRSKICVMHKSRRQNAQGWAGNKSETSFGTKLVLYRCTWTYIGREVHGCTLLDRLFAKGGRKDAKCNKNNRQSRKIQIVKILIY